MTRKLALCLALVFTARTADAAAPTAGAGPAVEQPASVDVDVDAALTSGELTGAREQAEAARKADPNVETWAAEAEVCERLADLACAKAARTRQRDLTKAGSPERAAVEAKLAALEDMSRGTVADEGSSTHRAELDTARSGRDITPAKPVPDTPDKPKPPRERIVKKWYFWVTLGAIAASAAAITVIGIKAARDEQGTELDASGGRVRLDQGFGIRF